MLFKYNVYNYIVHIDTYQKMEELYIKKRDKKAIAVMFFFLGCRQ